MSISKRGRTKYPGVTFRWKERLDGSGEERVYYVRYRRGGRGSKEVEEPVGRESEGMTAAKANKIRALMVAAMTAHTIYATGRAGGASRRLRSQWGESLRG